MAEPHRSLFGGLLHILLSLSLAVLLCKSCLLRSLEAGDWTVGVRDEILVIGHLAVVDFYACLQ